MSLKVGRGLWCQWFDAAKASGFTDREASRFATDKDEEHRDLQQQIRDAERKLADLNLLGAHAPTFGPVEGERQ